MRRFLIPTVLGFLLSLPACLLSAEKPNQLSAQEKASGWKLLFDGATTKGWHAPKSKPFPADRWTVEEGWLHCLAKGGGDIVSDDQFEEFELSWDWKLIEGGNSGVKYFIIDSRGPIGHEYQMIDDDKHPDGQKAGGKRVTAAFYDVLKPQAKTPLHAPGQINHSRIVVKGQQVEHWLNGVKVLEYTLGSQELKAAISASKFATTNPFGSRLRGHILLQDHNDKVWYRNIKIRSLAKN